MRHFFAYILIFLPFWGLAQQQNEEEKRQIIEERIEFIGDNLEDSDIDLTTYFDDLYLFYDDPINLNQTTFEELKRLRLLTDVQIQSILNYIERHGEMITIHELIAVEYLDRATIDLILPFVKVAPSRESDFKWKNALLYGKNEVFLRYQRVLSEKEGYRDQENDSLVDANKQYLGSPDQYYLRYRKTYKDRISWGLTAEKDAGEEFFRGTNKQGFDFYSGHLFLKDLWKFKQVAVGDFQVNVGQGLTMWSGFAMGKSADISSAKRYAKGLRPYTSVNESQFLRGGGVTIGLGDKIDLMAFGSYKKIDANITTDLDSTDLFESAFSSFQLSGYHRTFNEMEDKNQLGEFITGGELAYRGNSFRIGVSSIFTRYDQPLQPSSSLHNLYKFNGQQLFTGGLNYRWYYRRFTFYGETATSENLKLGTVNGFYWHADPKLDLLIVHRYYDREFQSIHSTAFGETGDNTGENGLYFGFKMRLSKRISAKAYYDLFQHTSFKWLTDDLSEGREIFAQFDFNISRNAKFYIRIRNKINERNTRDDVSGIDYQEKLNKTNVRLNYSQRISSSLYLKSRVAWNRFAYGDDVSHGFLMFQDIIYEVPKIPLKLYSRFAVFDAETYDARLYAYENDLLYVFSIPSYFNRGMRTYLMAKYEIGRNIDIWARWGLWSYDNVESISSGLEEIEGRNKMDLKLQMKIRF